MSGAEEGVDEPGWTGWKLHIQVRLTCVSTREDAE